MKRNIILAIILGMTALSANAQVDYEPFLQEGKVWNYEARLSWGSYNFQLQVKSDTIVEGRKCKQIWQIEDGYTVDEYIVFEEDRKVYRYMKKNKYRLLYDFGCNVGDLISLDGIEEEAKVNEIDTVECNGKRLRRITVAKRYEEDEPFEGSYVWVEGVGSSKFFDTSLPYFFVSCEINGQTLYTDAVFSPENGTINGMKSTGMVKTPNDNSLYDLQGRTVTGTPNPGIYIQEGRKRVVR